MRLSLRARFAFTLAGLIIISSAVLSALIGQRAGSQTEAGIGEALADKAYQMADRLDQTMWSRTQEMQILSSLDAIRKRGKDPAAARRLLDKLREAIPLYSWVGLLAPDGTVVEATDGVLKGKNIAERPVFAEAREKLFIGDVHDAVLLSKLLPNPTGEAMKFVDVSVPLRDDAGGFTGVLAAHLSWEWAREIEEAFLSAFKETRGMDLFIIAADGTVLLGDRAMLGKRLDLGLLGRTRSEPRVWAVEDWPDGRSYLTGAAMGDGFRSYKGLGWTVVARQPLDVAYAPVRVLLSDIFLAGAALAGLFALGGWLISRRVSQPLKALTEAADRLRLGEDVALPEDKGIPEIQTLSASFTALISSLTRSEDARHRMERLATRDPLTGLSNRLGLSEYLATALPRLKRQGGVLEALCLDLDGFKRVNDTLGHQAGDQLLREVAQRLGSCLRGGDLLARLGGDEFLVLLERPGADAGEVEGLGRRIIESVARPYALDQGEANIGVSIGAASWPQHAEAFEDVLAKADAALYAAKTAGKGVLRRHGQG